MWVGMTSWPCLPGNKGSQDAGIMVRNLGHYWANWNGWSFLVLQEGLSFGLERKCVPGSFLSLA